jgi:hypothetical protein
MAEGAEAPKVFVSYAAEDNLRVKDLCSRLTDEGFNVWRDADQLLPGEDWRSRIEATIEEADVVVVCLSSTSVSKEGFVQKEIRYVLDIADEKPDGTIFVIPVLLDHFELPRRLRRWHWVDLNGKNAYAKIAEAITLRDKKARLPKPSGSQDNRADLGAYPVQKPLSGRHFSLHFLFLVAVISAFIGAIATRLFI